MMIIVHRGIDQIGGCITGVTNDNTRILIDLGQNLPNGEGIVDDDLVNGKVVGEIIQVIDATFNTSYAVII